MSDAGPRRIVEPAGPWSPRRVLGRVLSRVLSRGPAGFRDLVRWCAVACLTAPVLLALAGLPIGSVLRTAGVLLTATAGIVAWWACVELARGGGSAVDHGHPRHGIGDLLRGVGEVGQLPG